MGILPDLPHCQANFTDPKDATEINLLDGTFVNVMHAFNMEFYLKFDPKTGIGGATPIREQWQVGIVQNVVYEHLRYEYEGKTIFETEFVPPALDTMAKKSLPFYGEPYYELAPPMYGIPSKKKIPIMVPVISIWLTPKGYGSELNPSDPSGVKITNEPSSVNIMDQPGFGARTRLANGAMIKKADHILSFQAWLVAIKGTQLEVMASCEPFSLISNLTFDDRDKQKEYGLGGTPQFVSSFHGAKGIERRLRTDKNGTPNVAIVAGNGGRPPVTSGTSATTRGRGWLLANDLVPRK